MHVILWCVRNDLITEKLNLTTKAKILFNSNNQALYILTGKKLMLGVRCMKTAGRLKTHIHRKGDNLISFPSGRSTNNLVNGFGSDKTNSLQQFTRQQVLLFMLYTNSLQTP